jgi:hypothetical protein
MNACRDSGVHDGASLAARLTVLLLPPPPLLLLLLLQIATDTPWSPNGPAPHPLYNLHRYLGVVAIAFSVLQVRKNRGLLHVCR